MNEVTDPVKLRSIGTQIQAQPLTMNTLVQWRCTRAWEYSSNGEDGHPTLYHVELTSNYGYVLKGVLDYMRGLLYLDAISLLLLVQDRIGGTIADYNAHSSPYYRGM